MYHKQYEYDELNKIDEIDYNKVTIVRINDDINDIQKEDIYDSIYRFKNIKEIIFNNKICNISLSGIGDVYLQNNSFSNKIALFKKLSNIEVEFSDCRFIFYEMMTNYNLYYVYNNYMLIINWINSENLPNNITHLNIININDTHMEFINNLPNHIEKLHLSCVNYDCLINITNLPITLRKLSITIITHDSNLRMDYSNIKIPFSCKFENDYIVY
jgi:hypothetical protein